MPEDMPDKPNFVLPPIREFNDRATLWLLEDPTNLRDLLQICEPDLAPRLDFARALRVNRSFIPADLQKEESDLIYRVPLRDGGPGNQEIWIYTLLEHQSKPDPLMPLRLYLYIGHLWDSQRREWEDENLPEEQRRLHLVVPLVFYTGRQNWTTPIQLSEMMDVPPDFERFVPRWETLFLPLHRSSAETLTRFSSVVGWALRVLQAEREPLAEMERVLKEALMRLEGLSEEQSGQWLRVAWYLVLLVFHRRSSSESPELIALIQEQTRQSKFHEREEWQQMEQSYAEFLEERGYKQGEQKGEQTGARRSLRDALRMVLAERFGPVPPEEEAAIAGADLDRLNDWLRIAITAPDLQAVGILSQA